MQYSFLYGSTWYPIVSNHLEYKYYPGFSVVGLQKRLKMNEAKEGRILTSGTFLVSPLQETRRANT